jgi:hypothetical protein
MKELLDEFMHIKKKTLLKIFSFEFRDWIEKEHPKVDKKEAYNFCTKLQKEKKAKAEQYEEQHLRKTIRFSKEEFAEIEVELQKADIKNFSQWAKSVLLKKKIKLPIEQKRIIQLSKIGTNLNQIAKQVNSSNIDDEIATALLNKLVEIEKAVKE